MRGLPQIIAYKECTFYAVVGLLGPKQREGLCAKLFACRENNEDDSLHKPSFSTSC